MSSTALIAVSTWSLLGGSSFVFAQSTGQKECTVAALTNNCKDIKKNPPRSNPWALSKSMDDRQLHETGEEADSIDMTQTHMWNPEIASKLEEQALRTQVELMGQLPGSDLFKIAVTGQNNLEILGSAGNSGEEDMDHGLLEDNLSIPWPANDPNARIQKVSIEEFKKSYWNKLPARQKELFEKRAQEFVKAKNPPVIEKKEDPKKVKERERKDQVHQAYRGSVEQQKSAEIKRFEDMLKKAKELLIAELRERPPEGSAETLNAMIKRIETITFSGEPESVHCEDEPKNAFYFGSRHEIIICSGVSEFSDEDLIFTLGHEIGHSIDPCLIRQSIYKTNKRAEEETLAKISGKQEYSGGGSQEIFVKEVAVQSNRGQYISGINRFTTKASEEQLIKDGVVTKETDAIKGTYPFDSTLRCLIDQHGFAGAVPQGNHLNKQRGKRIPRPQETNLNDKDFDYCNQSTEMQEAMSDVFGAKVLGRYLTGKRSRSANQDPGTFMNMFLEGACSGDTAPKPYPYDRERLEKIVFAEPSVSSAFNCKPSPKYFCLNKFGSVGSSQKKMKSGTDSKTGEANR